MAAEATPTHTTNTDETRQRPQIPVRRREGHDGRGRTLTASSSSSGSEKTSRQAVRLTDSSQTQGAVPSLSLDSLPPSDSDYPDKRIKRLSMDSLSTQKDEQKNREELLFALLNERKDRLTPRTRYVMNAFGLVRQSPPQGARKGTSPQSKDLAELIAALDQKNDQLTPRTKQLFQQWRFSYIASQAKTDDVDLVHTPRDTKAEEPETKPPAK